MFKVYSNCFLACLQMLVKVLDSICHWLPRKWS